MCQCSLCILIWLLISILMLLLTAEPSSTAGLSHHSVSPWNDLGDLVFDGMGLVGFTSRANALLLAQAVRSIFVFYYFAFFGGLVLLGWGRRLYHEYDGVSRRWTECSSDLYQSNTWIQTQAVSHLYHLKLSFVATGKHTQILSFAFARSKQSTIKQGAISLWLRSNGY